MSTDYRDALQELHTSIQLYTGQNPAAADVHPAELTRRLMDAMAASAAALTQPEPESLLARIDTLLDGIDRDECHPDGGWWQTSDGSKFGRIKLRELKGLVSAAHLAQPEPVAPTDEALKAAYWEAFKNSAACGAEESWLAGLRSVGRYGTPAIHPAPVDERLPGPEDLNGEGWCWWFDGLNWMLDEPENRYTHWLPANALPTPEAKR
jgi:hypothetical protein